jgi:hypothetical protein
MVHTISLHNSNGEDKNGSRDIDSKRLGVVGSEERVVEGVWKRYSVSDSENMVVTTYDGYLFERS